MPYTPKNHKKDGGDTSVIGGELQIAAGGKITAVGTQAAHIANEVAAAGANPTKTEYDALVTKFNAVLAALEGVGITATS